MASPSENAPKFVKLNGSNCEAWAFNMRLYLKSFDLYEHADGTAEPPASTANAEMNGLIFVKAWTYICLPIETEQQIHVRETENAKQAWDALRNQFARESLLQKIAVMTQRIVEDAFSARRGKFGKSWCGSGNTKSSGNTNQQNDKVFRGKCHTCQEKRLPEAKS
ncbi:Hypothetical predicted protein [Paramuricea clavata]|uniref:Uncharacterized protein n=1 Tax=Paramuricea clavata TaxID=317549 RepID=A0A6S7G0T3_PARCT|nr:Hypothetical predicted protein [Paramuricea clavata]